MAQIFKDTVTTNGWAVWYITPELSYVYSETFSTRKEAREYWTWKTEKNPTYKVVKVRETVRTVIETVA